MNTSAATRPAGPIFYPESDGQPMSENTRQFRWIVTLAGNLTALFRDRPDVFVCGNQNWYPVEGEPEVCVSPDVYAVFGRPKGDRGSYKQWEEGGVPLTVVFEILSSSNTDKEMADKRSFYEEHGVEEYYVYNPDTNTLQGYGRQGSALLRIRSIDGFVSPRLGICFDLSGPELVVRHPDGRPFLTFEDLDMEREQAVRRTAEAVAEREQAVRRTAEAVAESEQAVRRAAEAVAEREQAERQVAEAAAEREQAVRRAAEAAAEREQAVRRAEELASEREQAVRRAAEAEQRESRLSELSRKVLRQQATAEERRELEQLLQEPPATP